MHVSCGSHIHFQCKFLHRCGAEGTFVSLPHRVALLACVRCASALVTRHKPRNRALVYFQFVCRQKYGIENERAEFIATSYMVPPLAINLTGEPFLLIPMQCARKYRGLQVLGWPSWAFGFTHSPPQPAARLLYDNAFYFFI
jgi:hypothetical protein